MKTQTLVIFAITLCAVLATASAGHGKGKRGKMKKCKDGEINMQEAFKGMQECRSEDKGSERRRRSPHGGGGGKRGKGKGFMGMKMKLCDMVCQWKTVGVLNSDGMFDESGTQEYVNRVYPESVRADAMSSMTGCSSEHSSKFSNENECAGYEDFKHCIMAGHMKTCGIEMKGKWKKGGGGEEE